MMNNKNRLALFISLLSALFFATTFVLNRQISLSGGSWMWSAALRYIWMLPFLILIVVLKGQLKPLIAEIKQQPKQWFLWSFIGFGVFYSLLTFSATYAPSWLVASTFQVTIIAGMLMAPFINKTSYKSTFSLSTFLFSVLMLLGVLITQISQAKQVSGKELFLGTAPVLIAAFVYPLGNRKMMQVTNSKLNAIQRTLGMTLCSLPLWIGFIAYEISQNNLPSYSQLSQTFLIGLFSGVIATTMFFWATDLVRKNEKSLAAVEAGQSSEVVFALLGEVMLLNAHLPDVFSKLGITLIILGVVLHSLKR